MTLLHFSTLGTFFSLFVFGSYGHPPQCPARDLAAIASKKCRQEWLWSGCQSPLTACVGNCACSACCSSVCWYAAPHHAQQSFQNPSAIISYSRVHVLICHPLSYALNLASCILGKLKVHIQILLCTDRADIKNVGQHSNTAVQRSTVIQQIGCVG